MIFISIFLVYFEGHKVTSLLLYDLFLYLLNYQRGADLLILVECMLILLRQGKCVKECAKKFKWKGFNQYKKTN